MTSYGQSFRCESVEVNDLRRKTHYRVAAQTGNYTVNLDLPEYSKTRVWKIDHTNSTTVTSNTIEFITRKESLFPLGWDVFVDASTTPGADEVGKFEIEVDSSVTPSIRKMRYVIADTAGTPAPLPATKRVITVQFSDCGQEILNP